jgi:uncharacterized protein YjbJ (UPF0337 family)
MRAAAEWARSDHEWGLCFAPRELGEALLRLCTRKRHSLCHAAGFARSPEPEVGSAVRGPLRAQGLGAGEEPDAEEIAMNWDQIEGQWHQVKGTLTSKWGKLTDDDVKNLSGKRELLVGKLQTRYGIMKDEAERQADEWIAKIPSVDAKAKEVTS